MISPSPIPKSHQRIARIKMSEPKVVNLADLEGTVEVEPNYHVELPSVQHFIIGTGAKYPDAATEYDHPNVVAKQDRVFETRAYWPDGRKKWFSHAGRDFFFVIPRNKIALVYEKGYSFVPVVINGQKFNFNVSGGTFNGWTDFVREHAHVGIGVTKAKLNLLAEVAVPPKDCNVSFDLIELSTSEAESFEGLIAAHACRQRLAVNDQLFLKEGWTFDGHRGPFLVESRPRKSRYYIARSGLSKVRISYTAIDWGTTAAANGFEVRRPVMENRVGQVKPYVNPYM